MSTLPPSIAALPGRTAEFGALLQRWASINSGSGHVAGLRRMADTLRDDFAAAFPGATITETSTDAPGWNPPGTVALSVRMRPTAPVQVVLCGHYDTVFEANDPFQTCDWPDAQTLHGPGTIDMKGGLVTMLAALHAFEQTPGAARLGWEVLLTPDEETGSHGSKHLFEQAAREHDFGFVYEPARPNGDIVHSRKGTGGFTAICHGKAAHAAKIPNDGRNAILALADFLHAINRLPTELPGVLVNVANIQGGGPATNVVPHFAKSQIDVRVTRMSDRDTLLARLQEEAAKINARDGYKLELQGGFNRPPKECFPVEELVFKEWQRAAADVGVKPFTWVHAGGASDGNNLSAAGLPCLDGLGPLGDQLHSDREYCRVDTIAPRAQLTALVLHRLATAELTLPARPRPTTK